jgi:hypothetical protein
MTMTPIFSLAGCETGYSNIPLCELCWVTVKLLTPSQVHTRITQIEDVMENDLQRKVDSPDGMQLGIHKTMLLRSYIVKTQGLNIFNQLCVITS